MSALEDLLDKAIIEIDMIYVVTIKYTHFALFSDISLQHRKSFTERPNESAAFLIVLKRRAHMLRIASVNVQNIRNRHRRRLPYLR